MQTVYFALTHLNLLYTLIAAAFFFLFVKKEQSGVGVLRVIFATLLTISIYHTAELYLPDIEPNYSGTKVITLFFMRLCLNSFLLYPILLSDKYGRLLKFIVKNYILVITCAMLYGAFWGLDCIPEQGTLRDFANQNNIFNLIENFPIIIVLLTALIPICFLLYSIAIGVQKHFVKYLIFMQFLPLCIIGNLATSDAYWYSFMSIANVGYFGLTLWLLCQYMPFNSLHREVEMVSSFGKQTNANEVQTNDMDFLMWKRVEKYIAEDEVWRDSGMSLESLVAEVKINRSKLSYVINRYSGDNFQNYIARLRVEAFIKAYRAEPNKKIEYLFEEVGFKSKSTGYTQFKRIMGVSPATYLKQNKD